MMLLPAVVPGNCQTYTVGAATNIHKVSTALGVTEEELLRRNDHVRIYLDKKKKKNTGVIPPGTVLCHSK